MNYQDADISLPFVAFDALVQENAFLKAELAEVYRQLADATLLPLDLRGLYDEPTREDIKAADLKFLHDCGISNEE